MNAADEKAWREYDSYIETAKVPFVDNTLSNEDAATVVKFILKAEKNSLIAGRASRNSEVEGLREAIILKDAVIAMHEGEIKQLRQALTKGDSDAG